MRADYVMANPPFNDSDWRGDLLKDDRRWKYGTPPAGNANFAWVQHFIHHLAPTGQAGFVLANGSMSSNQSGEGEIRKNIVEADLVDCMVALPGQLFYSTQIPVCLWFLTRDKKNNRFRDRRGSVLFIDARKMGTLIDRVHRELTTEDIKKIADTYHKWRGDKSVKGKYADVPGFCKSATLAEIREHGHILTPGRYVGAEEIEDDVNASLRVHKEWDFDNWNGGTYSHAVYLTIPDSIYLPLIDRKDDIEKKLCSDLEKFNNCPNEHIGAVFLEVDTPSDQHWRENSGLLHPKTKIVSKDIENKIWEQGKFRVFLSHKSEDKVQVGMLRDRLRIWGIHAFVAHEDIEPTAEWQKTIENALATMDSFVALMTDKFHDSNWTDQEVGYAMGSGVPIIAVNLGINPYGFIGKYQAIKSNWEKVENDIVSQLKRVVSIPDFIHAMKESTSDVSCKNLARYLTCLPDLSEREIDRIIDAYNTNAALLDCCDFNGTNQHDKNGSLHSILQKHTRREIIQEMSKKMRALPLPQPSAKSQPYQPEMDEVPF
ncbi:MAG TPA: hypothetical protein DEB39_02220 [Planctomycetaceae bacterium]|nr:hypothetical protein [Planctomycetaceae bacterium]